MKPDGFNPGPLAQVSCEVGDGHWTLVFVRELQHSPETVWAALTEPTQLREWAPYTADRNLSAVGDATLVMIDDAAGEELPVTVRVAESASVLEHTWGKDLLRWELTPTATGTRLTLRHTVDDESLVSQIAAGWHLCLVVAEHLLNGTPISPIRGETALSFGWEELRRAYIDKLRIVGEPRQNSR